MKTAFYRNVLSVSALLLIVPNVNFAQTYNGRFSTSVYSWERQDSPTISSGHVRVYQRAYFKANNLANKNLSLVANFSFSSDITTESQNDPRYRLVSTYLKYKFIKSNYLYFGRQRVYTSSATAAFDGVRLVFKKITNLVIDGYWGTNVPTDRGFELLDLKSNQVLGFKTSYKGLFGFDGTLSYSDIRREPIEYTEPGEFTNKLVQRQATQERFLGAGLRRKISDKFNISSRILLNYGAPIIGSGSAGFRKFQRFDLTGRYRHNKNLTVTTEYFIRKPRLNENSIFWVFNQKTFSEAAGRLYYRINSKLSLSGGLSLITYTETIKFEGLDDSSLRINAGLNWQKVSISFSNRSGYAGESVSTALSYSTRVRDKGILRVGGSYNVYKVNSEAEENNNAVTLFFGCTHNLNKTVSANIDVQYLSQDIKSQRDFFGYSNDVRLFARVDYKFRAGSYKK